MNAFREIFIFVFIAIALAPNILKAKEYKLEFSETGSLEQVFHSGLKPHRQPGFEKYKCEVRDVNISILLPNGVHLPSMPFEWAEFFVYKNNLLGNAEFRTASLSIDQARNLLLPFLNIIGASSQGRLESMFQNAAEDPLGFDPNFSAGVKGTPNWGVYVRKSFDKDKPLNIGLKIDWKRERTERAFRETVIEPPPGYENISMEPPPIQAQAQPSTTATQSLSILTQQPQSTAPATPSPKKTETKSAPSGFPVLPVAIIGVVIVGIVLYLLRRKSK